MKNYLFLVLLMRTALETTTYITHAGYTHILYASMNKRISNRHKTILLYLVAGCYNSNKNKSMLIHEKNIKRCRGITWKVTYPRTCVSFIVFEQVTEVNETCFLCELFCFLFYCMGYLLAFRYHIVMDVL